MAVFVALIFQVLFVLFAMVINIGLIVHDKINLQNAVDLGAYYGAERQAEALNEIAHINYQIRQDYKLLAWRYRVLGSFGASNHPSYVMSQTALAQPLQDQLYQPPSGAPAVCVGNSAWNEIAQGGNLNQNVCANINISPPVLQPIPIIAIFPGQLEAIGLFSQIQQTVSAACETISPYDWTFAASILGSFKVSVMQRKKMILKLAKDMSAGNDWNDITGASVQSGIIKTISKNLTQSNLASFQASNVQVINGLTLGNCNLAGGAGFPTWLQEIQIEPHVPFVQFLSPGAGSCSTSMQDASSAASIQAYAQQADPTGELAALAGEPAPTSIQHSSRGFEKNPWCMAYVGVKATTSPRKPFAPFGSAMTMEARAFAQPFGGRIGPWDKAAWPQGNPTSNGTQALDPLAVPRGPFDATVSSGATDSPYFPNYSRFPGDPLGLRSQIALGTFRSSFFDALTDNSAPIFPAKFKIADLAGIVQSDTTADPLSWNVTANAPDVQRPLELAAVAPDLFDITYYSIEPNYQANYLAVRGSTYYNGLVPMPDIGSRPLDASVLPVSVTQQISAAQNYPDVKQYAFYLVSQWDNMLTGWVQGRAIDYSADSATVVQKFGHCQAPIPASSPLVPGTCIAGGRTGYSVRIVHADYLKSQNHQLGGADGSTGPLMNPPPDTF